MVVVLDWYDGPREGLCTLEFPPARFYFRLLAERQDPDGLDDRLFALFALPEPTATAILSLLDMPSVHPDSKTIVPAPRPGSSGGPLHGGIEALTKDLMAMDTVIRSRDLLEFQGCWRVDTRKSVGNWFAELGLA